MKQQHECEVSVLTPVQLQYWITEAEKLSPKHVEAIKEQNLRQLDMLFGSHNAKYK